MTYEQAINEINSLLVFGSRPGLERINALLERLDNPQKKLKFVHVAGTNGKGSTCNIIANILISSGYKTGFFISPFILDFRERIQINGEYISKEDLCHIVQRVMPIVKEMASNGEIITEFELITVIGFLYFAEQGCDVVVLETGLGGRYDATNVIDTPLCSVITSISLDHTAILGDTLEKIASEKCGIIKKDGNTCYFPQELEVNNVIMATAANKNNKIYTATDNPALVENSDINGTYLLYSGVKFHLPLIGKHQVKNACTALCAIGALVDMGYNITTDTIKQGFSNVYMPARLEVLNKKPLIILDGAHNPGGIQALASTIHTYVKTEVVFVMGMLKDKDATSSLEYLQGLGNTVITLTPNNPRRQTAYELAKKAENFFSEVIPMENYDEAIKKALDLVGSSKAMVICGSLYLASDLRPIILRHLKHIFDN